MSENKGKNDKAEPSKEPQANAVAASGPESSSTEVAAEQIDARRRALIRAGWAVPVITAVPGLAFNAAYAQSPHGDGHSDSSHGDHSDAHSDAGHTDAGHSDVHGDVPHLCTQYQLEAGKHRGKQCPAL